MQNPFYKPIKANSLVKVVGRSHFEGFTGTVLFVHPKPSSMMPIRVQLEKWPSPVSFSRGELKVIG